MHGDCLCLSLSVLLNNNEKKNWFEARLVLQLRVWLSLALV